MARRNPPAKWVLPDVIDPPDRLCFEISVPNNPYHIAAFRGALLNLASAINWSDDVAHTAKDVALVWRDIVDAVDKCKICPPIKTGGGGGIILPMFRQNPDKPCELQVSMGNDCWCTIFDASKCNPNPTQPGGEEPNQGRPSPGQSKEDCYTLYANGALNLPYTVYPGDTVEITSMTGAGWDGSVITEWNCPDGSVYFAGACTGIGHTSGSDPLPAVKHMALIVNIGGTYHDGTAGPITVTGSGPQPVVVQVNDNNISDNAGSYQICVKVTNNQALSWHHVFDFTLSPYSTFWAPTIYSGTPQADYTSGIGYTQISFININWYEVCEITCTMPTATITAVETYFDYSTGTLDSTGDHTYDLYIGATAELTTITPSVPVSPKVWAGSESSNTMHTQVMCGVKSGAGSDPGGTATIKKIVISGTGADPFQGVPVS